MNRRKLIQVSAVGAFGGLLPSNTTPALASDVPATFERNLLHYFPANPGEAPFPSPPKSRIIGMGGAPYLVDRFGVVFTLGTPRVGGRPVKPTYYSRPVAPSANVGYVAYANGAPQVDDVAALTGEKPNGWAVIYFTQLVMDGSGYCWAQAANGQWYKYTGSGFHVQGSPPSFATSTNLMAAPITTGAIPARPTLANPGPGSTGKTLEVGASKTYKTISAAVAAAPAGATVLVDSGTYNESFEVRVPLLLKANGGIVVMNMTGLTSRLAAGKAAIVPMADCIIDGTWDISGVALDQSEAQLTSCIRPDVGCNYLTLRNGVHLHASQFGLGAGGNLPNLTIYCQNILVEDCGVLGGQSHNIYVDNIRALIVTSSISRDPRYGHAIKSRALYTEITGHGYVNAANASPIDLPDGTAIPAFIGGITISKSATDGNHNAFSQNEESTRNGTAGTVFGSDVVWEIACAGPFLQIGAGNVWNVAPWPLAAPTVAGNGKISGF